MKDFEKLKNESLQDVINAGIKPGEISSWKINGRAKSRWGLCAKKPDGTYEIQISEQLLVDERISERVCKETLIHEILHTSRGCMKHTGKWKIYAETMNNLYGYNIKRVKTGAEIGIEDYDRAAEMPVKYVFVCGKCGATVYRKRASRFTKHYRMYGCVKCGAAAWQKKEMV